MAKGMSGLKGHTPKATHINNSGASAKWLGAKALGQVTINSGAVKGSAPGMSGKSISQTPTKMGGSFGGKGKAPRSKTAC
jgi:hypothetical protein